MPRAKVDWRSKYYTVHPNDCKVSAKTFTKELLNKADALAVFLRLSYEKEKYVKVSAGISSAYDATINGLYDATINDQLLEFWSNL